MLQSTDSIPKNIDCLVLGTGLTNSIVAAACSRIGKSVLHVDENNYYGSNWASFTFQQLIDWIKVNQPNDESLESIPAILEEKSRLFCIDLCPKLLFSNGAMVDLLVKSNVSRYHEFKNNIRILSMIGDVIQVMPCGRNDVFNSSILTSLLDKRRLMKFIEMCMQYDPSCPDKQPSDISDHGDKPIADYLKAKGFNDTLQEFIINSIAMIRPIDPMGSACQNIRRFIDATRIYGKSPFMFPIYGCGEFPQSFCRLSAVFGGIYCLNTQVDKVKIFNNSKDPVAESENSAGDKSQPLQTNTNEQEKNFMIRFAQDQYEVRSKTLVVDYESAGLIESMDLTKAKSCVSRAILITDKSIKEGGDDSISYLRLSPSATNENLVHVLEFNSSATVCPPNINIVYIWTKSKIETNPKSCLSPIVQRVFKSSPDCILWSFFYNQLHGFQELSTSLAEVEDLYVTNPPCDDLDYHQNIEEARRIFKSICPDEEFLPRAPDPNEIINTF